MAVNDVNQMFTPIIYWSYSISMRPHLSVSCATRITDDGGYTNELANEMLKRRAQYLVSTSRCTDKGRGNDVND